jgi:hypothetical protein
MHGLSNWTPQPVVPPLVHEPIEKKYMRQRLYEQLHNATNGFTVNIFKVVGYGAQTLPPGHPGLMDQEGDADGELLLVGQVASIFSFLHNDVLPARPSNVKYALLSSTSLRIIRRLGHKLAFGHSEDLLTGVMDDPATGCEMV